MQPQLTRQDKEILIALRGERHRRRSADPLDLFSLLPKQQVFVNNVLYNDGFENYFIGANRSGKSDVGAYTGATLARFGYPEQSPFYQRYVAGKGSTISVRDRATSGWVTSLDYPTSRDIIQPKYFDNGYVPPGSTHDPFIPDREVESWDEREKILKLKNGSIVGFKSADSGRSKYQGVEKDWVHVDEEHPEPIIDEIGIRIGARPLNIFTTATLLPPEGQVGGITWLWTKVISPWKRGQKPDVKIVNPSIYENPHLPATEITRLEHRYPEGSVQRRIRLGGELLPGLSGSRVYSGFSHERNIAEIGVPLPRMPLAWCWDFNVEPMATLVGQYDKVTFRIFEELTLDEGSIPDMCALFLQKYAAHPGGLYIYGDAKGKDRSHQTKTSSYRIVSNHIQDFASGFMLKVPESNPAQTARIDAVNTACADHRGAVGLLVGRDCIDLIDDFDQVMSDGRGGIKKITNRKDPYFRRTHWSDCLGYWIAYERPVTYVRPVNGRGSAKKIPLPGYGFNRRRVR